MCGVKVQREQHLPTATEEVQVGDGFRAEDDVPITHVDHLPGPPDGEGEVGALG